MISQDIADVQAAADLADELGMPRTYGEDAYRYYETQNWHTDDGQPVRNRGAVLTASIRRRWDITCKKPNYHPTEDEVLCSVRKMGFSDDRARSWHRQMTKRGWPIRWWHSSLEGAAKKWREWGDEPEHAAVSPDASAAWDTFDDTGCPWTPEFDPLAPLEVSPAEPAAPVTAEDVPVLINQTGTPEDRPANIPPTSAPVAAAMTVAAVDANAVHEAVYEAVHEILSEYVSAETSVLKQLLAAMNDIRQGQRELLQRMDALEQSVEQNATELPY